MRHKSNKTVTDGAGIDHRTTLQKRSVTRESPLPASPTRFSYFLTSP
jgi:hypothetical protein